MRDVLRTQKRTTALYRASFRLAMKRASDRLAKNRASVRLAANRASVGLAETVVQQDVESVESSKAVVVEQILSWE